MILPSLAIAGTLALALTAEATLSAAAPPHPPSGYKRSHKSMSVKRTINETIATLPEDLAFYNEAVERVRQGGRPRKRQVAACGTDVPAVPAPSNLPPIAGTPESPKFNSTWRLDHEAVSPLFCFWLMSPAVGSVPLLSFLPCHLASPCSVLVPALLPSPVLPSIPSLSVDGRKGGCRGGLACSSSMTRPPLALDFLPF